jgi:hypothetical protein
MRCTIFALTISTALSVLIATPALAQQPLKLSFQNGLVSVEATSVPVRTILNEWAKIGGTKVIGAERIAGAPLTVKLLNVTEAQALETILRSVAGYMAAPRSATTTGPSTYDRILVMATTSAPAPAAGAARPTPGANNAFNGTQRFVPQRPQRSDQEQEEQEEVDENPPNPPVFTFPQQQGNQNGVVVPGTFLNAPQPGVNVAPGTNPGTITINPAQQNGPQTPMGVPQPGMMVPAPQPQPGTQPPGMIRPPGRK